jgi:hypothetical protein
MQSANAGTGRDCEQFFAAFDQIKISDHPVARDTGLTVFQVENLLGPPSSVSSGVGQNVYMYNVGRCNADIEFVNGRIVRKTFAIVATPVPHETRPPESRLFLWALAIIAAIVVVAIVWYVRRKMLYRYEVEPERQLVTPEDFQPDGPLPILNAARFHEPQDDPAHARPWHEAS